MQSMISSRTVAKIHVAAISSKTANSDSKDREKVPLVAEKGSITDYETIKDRVTDRDLHVMHHDHIMLEDHIPFTPSTSQTGTNNKNEEGIELPAVTNLERDNPTMSNVLDSRANQRSTSAREQETADSIHEEFYGRIAVGESAGKLLSQRRIQGMLSQESWGHT
jgi:phosphoribosylaminoimidazole carboxylase (NCAIR synthetase)